MTAITPIVAANGFAVRAVQPSPPACKRLLSDGFIVDTDDGILRYRETIDVEQSHMVDGVWCHDVVGVYQVKGGNITACDMAGWAKDEQQALSDDDEDAQFREQQKYW